MSQNDNNTLKLLPLGGLGEIGLNMMALAVGNDAIVIDTGLLFPDSSMPGVDYVIPDMAPLLDLNWKVHGIFLTHGHEDHIGALPYVVNKINAPVYGTPLTMGFVEHKLSEFGLLESTTRNILRTDSQIEVSKFKVEAFRVCHSVADAVGLAIKTPAGVVIHSGDFKLDPTPIDGMVSEIERLEKYSGERTLALLSDSTNVEREGHTPSEISVRPALEKVFQKAQGRILIGAFSSSIHRIQQICDLAIQYNRRVILMGRSMESNVEVAKGLGRLVAPDDLIMDIKDINGVSDKELTIISTGSQGEPMSALSLMAWDRHKYLKIKRSDTLVFSSRFIPGNEKAINSIINEFSRRGARVLHEKVAHVHVSGHASKEELKLMLQTVKPRLFIPIHGEYRHLQLHADIAMGLGIPPERVVVAQNGDLIEISEDYATICEQLPVGRIFVDGKGVGDVGGEVLRERRALSDKGFVIVALVVDRRACKLIAGPELTSKGVTFQEVAPELMDGAREAVLRLLKEAAPRTPQQWEDIKDEARLAARRHINQILGRKPQVQTLLIWA